MSTDVSAALAGDFVKQALSNQELTADLTGERILDAALEQFQLAGLRRSSVEDVARRAGVGRITVYRRFPQKDRLVEAVVLRECRRVIAQVDSRAARFDDLSERTAESFVVMLEAVRRHPLVTRLLDVEPESILRFLTVGGEALLRLVSGYIAGQIRRAQDAGELRRYDPEPVAEIIARLAHSLLLTPQGSIPVDDDSEARRFARSHIVPIISAANDLPR